MSREWVRRTDPAQTESPEEAAAAIRADYLDFADRQLGALSPSLGAWCRMIASDDQMTALIAGLPPHKRQPNLVLAAVRRHGGTPGDTDSLRAVLVGHWEQVRATVLTHATQTNEAGRCAALLPVLAGLPGPLALLEVGASAGLCLYPDRYGYRYTRDGSSPAGRAAQGDGEGTAMPPPVTLQPSDGISPVLLDCVVTGPAPIPDALPQVVWRRGIDLNPLSVADEDHLRWLELLVWPEQEHRRSRLLAAAEVVRADPPRITQGDLLTSLESVAAEAPEGATLVVFHTAVLAYLERSARAQFVDLVASMPGHWISNEGQGIVPGIESPRTDEGEGVPFLLALDGQAVAFAAPHGERLFWLE